VFIKRPTTIKGWGKNQKVTIRSATKKPVGTNGSQPASQKKKRTKGGKGIGSNLVATEKGCRRLKIHPKTIEGGRRSHRPEKPGNIGKNTEHKIRELKAGVCNIKRKWGPEKV